MSKGKAPPTEQHPGPGKTQTMGGFVLADGSTSSNQPGEGDIRRALAEADLVGCMVALPGELFYRFEQ
jgi:type I restriction-modification system DNA methylase subunit